MEEKKQVKRRFKGKVVSDKMEKTIVVRIDTTKTHPKYFKKYTSRRNFKVHDEKGVYKVGDIVVFEDCRPISKDKKWRVVYEKINK
ncbi:MAG: 30S ribosomal protein S17 [Parcubacteria group bacterium]|nr:30S ribosomal protein S17 [Parcubacteria group bacterium]